MQITLQSIGSIHNSRTAIADDDWGEIISEITLDPNIPSGAFAGIEAFSHLEILFYFDKVDDATVVFSGRPRGNPDYPSVGIFSQRKKDRPNKIGLCTVQLLEHNGRAIKVKGLDAIDGTPVLDIKPVFREFQPRIEIIQPEWVSDLMQNYW
jgi:tRNA-Thr(GGU) m(6)t(6)A37 methyltransferase TsaA